MSQRHKAFKIGEQNTINEEELFLPNLILQKIAVAATLYVTDVIDFKLSPCSICNMFPFW